MDFGSSLAEIDIVDAKFTIIHHEKHASKVIKNCNGHLQLGEIGLPCTLGRGVHGNV